MALKVGTENKRNVIIAAALGCVLVYLVISQLLSGSSTPAPVARRTAPPVARRAGSATGGLESSAMQATTSTATGAAPSAHKVGGPGANAALNPALHLDRLALSESIEYAGSGRNIFSADSAPVQVEEPVAAARPDPAAELAAAGPPPPPQPPAIDLHYFGYSADKAGKRQAFLLHGDDIFEASAGDIVNHRYKVVTVDAHSVQVTDLSYNNTQTLPLSGN